MDPDVVGGSGSRSKFGNSSPEVVSLSHTLPTLSPGSSFPSLPTFSAPPPLPTFPPLQLPVAALPTLPPLPLHLPLSSIPSQETTNSFFTFQSLPLPELCPSLPSGLYNPAPSPISPRPLKRQASGDSLAHEKEEGSGTTRKRKKEKKGRMSTGSEMGSDAEMDKSDDLFVLDADKSSEDGEGDEELEPENGDESEFESENESDEEAAQTLLRKFNVTTSRSCVQRPSATQAKASTSPPPSSERLPLPSEKKLKSGADFLSFLQNSSPLPEIQEFYQELPSSIAKSAPSEEEEKEWEELQLKTLEKLTKICRDRELPIDLEHLSLPLGSLSGVAWMAWNYGLPSTSTHERGNSIWDPEGSKTWWEVSQIFSKPVNGTLVTDFHHHPSPNRMSKNDGASPESPYLTCPGVGVEDALVILEEVTIPHNQQIVLARALPPKGSLRFNIVCGADVKFQTLATLEEVVELAKKNGRSVEVLSDEVLVPVEGIRLEAQGEKKAREIPNGLSSLDVVYIKEGEKIISSFIFIKHLSHFFYAGSRAYRDAASTQEVFNLFADFSRIPNGFSSSSSSSPPPALTASTSSSSSSSSTSALPPSASLSSALVSSKLPELVPSATSPASLPLDGLDETLKPLKYTFYLSTPTESSLKPHLATTTVSARLLLHTLGKFDDRTPEQKAESYRRKVATEKQRLEAARVNGLMYGGDLRKKKEEVAKKDGKLYGGNLQRANAKKAKEEGTMFGHDKRRVNKKKADEEGRLYDMSLKKDKAEKAKAEGRLYGNERLKKEHQGKLEEEGKLVGYALKQSNKKKAEEEGRLFGTEKMRANRRKAEAEGVLFGPTKAKENAEKAKQAGEVYGWDVRREKEEKAKADGELYGPGKRKANAKKAKEEGRLFGEDLRAENWKQAEAEGKTVGWDLRRATRMNAATESDDYNEALLTLAPFQTAVEIAKGTTTKTRNALQVALGIPQRCRITKRARTVAELCAALLEVKEIGLQEFLEREKARGKAAKK